MRAKLPRYVQDFIAHEGKSFQDLKVFHQQILKHKITLGWSPLQKLWMLRQVQSRKNQPPKIIELRVSTLILTMYMDDPDDLIRHFQDPNF